MKEPIKFRNRGDLKSWLAPQPKYWSRFISTRVSLRILPVIGRIHNTNSENLGKFAINLFRLNWYSWASLGGKIPNSPLIPFHRIANATRSDNELAAYGARTARAAAVAADSAYTAAVSAYTAIYAENPTAYAADSAYAASAAYVTTSSDRNKADPIWESVSSDARILKHAHSETEILEKSLWENGAPESIKSNWVRFLLSNFSEENQFDPWIYWYSTISSIGIETEYRENYADRMSEFLISKNEGWWNRAAREINLDIINHLSPKSKLLDTSNTIYQIDEALNQLPSQQPAPYQFDWRDGRMEVLPPEALPEDGGIAQDYLDETREKANNLLDHLARSNVDPDIARKVGKLREALTERTADLRPAVVDSRTITIERLLKRLDNPQDTAELSSRILSDLDDLAETARRLCQCLPELWLRDVELLARGLTGDSAAALLTNLNALRDGIKDAEIIGPDVQAAFDTLSEESAEPADEALKKRRTAMFAVTVRNFLNALLRVAKGSSPVVAGELLRFAKDVGKELRPELVKATAKIVLSGVSITAIAGLFVSLSIPIDGIWRLIPGAETVGRIVEYLKAGSSEAPPPEPSAPPPRPPPPRTARPTSEKGPTRPT
jgi:hypothetical protein